MATTSKSFVRVLNNDYFMDLIKEARRVKYIVKKDDMMYKVTDDETGDEVFSGMRHNGNNWVTRFSTLYWQQPAL